MTPSKAESNSAFLAVVEPVIDKRIPIRVFKRWNTLGKAEPMLPLVQDIFRRIPDVLHSTMVRLSRSAVNSMLRSAKRELC